MEFKLKQKEQQIVVVELEEEHLWISENTSFSIFFVPLGFVTESYLSTTTPFLSCLSMIPTILPSPQVLSSSPLFFPSLPYTFSYQQLPCSPKFSNKPRQDAAWHIASQQAK